MAGDGASVDRISHLPPDVTDCILRFLPLKYAVRMSSLSTYWRYKWALLPQLILDSQVFSASGQKTSLEFPQLVNNILLLHVGPIHNFLLHIPSGFPKDANMSQWIQYVSGKSVKEFTLFLENVSIEPTSLRKLPSSMFSCVGFNDLTNLTLIGFNSLSLPSTFRGFPFLISLTVKMYISTGEAYKLESIVSKCPQLESLDLNMSERESSLTINAPKLENLVLIVPLSSIHLQETTKIKTLSLGAELNLTGNMLINFFRCLPNIEKLLLHWRFWETNGLSDFGLPEKLKNTIEFRKLKYLQLSGVTLYAPPVVSFILALFQISPMLQKLEIHLSINVISAETVVLENCQMYHLKYAKVWCCSSSSIKFAIQLTKLILSSSPALEIMHFQSYDVGAKRNLNIAKELLRCHRASPNIGIIFKT